MSAAVNVFVLCTGRCGSVTFSKACEHLTNYTTGHETLSNWRYARVMDFGDQHIEVDCRIAWYLGAVGKVFGDRAFYVHLIRDPDLVAQSFVRKAQQFNSPYGVARAWCEVMRSAAGIGIEAYMSDMVTAVNDNISEYLRDKDHMVIDLSEGAEMFPEFCARIGAEGDIPASQAEFNIQHNKGQ